MIKLSDEWIIDEPWQFKALFHTPCVREAYDANNGYVLSVYALKRDITYSDNQINSCTTCAAVPPKEVIDKLKFIYATKKL